MDNRIELLGVVGAGQMGAGIAQVAAQSGLSVVMVDRDASAVARGLGTIRSSMAKLVTKERLSAEDAAAAEARLSAGVDWAPLAGAQLVIEAATEREATKHEIFEQLHGLCGSETLFASNTSSISITRLAARSGRAERFVGMHFMNPVPLMRLVEVIRGLQTSDETFDAVCDLATRMNKTTVTSQDGPGFIVNRILMPMINEAVYALADGLATAEHIDTAMKLGTNQPMGPLALADLIGLDTCLSIMEVLHEGFGDSKYRPCPLLRRYVDAGRLGRKTGRGFHVYA